MKALSMMYCQGHLYSLTQIQGLTKEFKFLVSRPSAHGLFLLYKQKSNGHLWVSGPFKGPHSNGFLYLGYRKIPKEISPSLFSIVMSNLKSDLKKLQSSWEDRHSLASPMDLFSSMEDYYKISLGLELTGREHNRGD